MRAGGGGAGGIRCAASLRERDSTVVQASHAYRANPFFLMTYD